VHRLFQCSWVLHKTLVLFHTLSHWQEILIEDASSDYISPQIVLQTIGQIDFSFRQICTQEISQDAFQMVSSLSSFSISLTVLRIWCWLMFEDMDGLRACEKHREWSICLDPSRGGKYIWRTLSKFFHGGWLWCLYMSHRWYQYWWLRNENDWHP
jgi:hypothetical protein